MNSLERQRIVLAALLHDIGKFWQRADEKWDSSDNLSKYYKNKNESYDITVPLYENRNPKYVHALWTNAFLEQTQTGEKFNLDKEKDNTLANLSANHHKPNNHNEALISIADRWSSGIDRPDEGEEGVSGYKVVKNEFGKDFVRKVGMHSVFDMIDKEYNELSTHHIYPVNPLFLNKDTLFPKDRTSVNNLQDEYKEQWSKFYTEYKKLLMKDIDFDAFYISLLTLLKKYTWSIPSATNILPANVSLYEHLKSTAGIALSLYDYFEDKKTKLKIDQDYRIIKYPSKDPLLMVCADVSGIQKFIYDIANKKAAASLKGRSFYIEMLIQNIIDEIIYHKDINVYKSNVIYSSGGKAYIILPNTDKVKKALDNIEDKIGNNLFNDTEGRLFVAIGYTSFRYESTYGDIVEGDFTGTKGYINKFNTDDIPVKERYETKNDTFNLSMLWRSVSDKAAEQKNRKFEKILIEKFDDLFVSGEDYSKNEKCSVMGTAIKGEPIFLDEDKTLPVSKIVYDQVELGKELRNTKFIEYSNKGTYTTAGLGKRFSLVSQSKNDYNTRTYLNEWPDLSRHKGGLGHIFYGGNYQPQQKERPKTFEELATTDTGESTKLAILRMDVDNLGQIFISGIKNKSFASYATLSMMLDTFFSGYINTIQFSDQKFKENIQILYSGGDDVFAVGRWDAIVEFADKIREGFREFVKRDDITISAGITIVNAKHPISKAAEDAGEAESRAKKFVRQDFIEEGRMKDAIDIFGQTIGWGKEWNEVKILKNQFIKFENDTGRVLLHAVQNYKVRKDDSIKREIDGEGKDLSYIWHSGYQLSRMMERLKKKKEAQDFIKSIRNRLMHDPEFSSERFLDLAAVAARWAEFSLKDKNEK